MSTRFETGLDRNSANYETLSPLSFLRRAERVFGERLSLIDGDRQFTWAQTAERCRKLASALCNLGIGKGDTVAIMAHNVTAMYEAHFGVPLSGAVLTPLNIRLDTAALIYVLRHSQARVLLYDTEFAPVVMAAIEGLDEPPVLIGIDETGHDNPPASIVEYESWIAGAEAAPWSLPDDEWNAIALIYTSGTTGEPKGVIYHHRGAYLNALDNIVGWTMPQKAVYLWSLPMFHCNGWCFPWSLAAIGGVSVCLRHVRANVMLDAIASHGVTHMCGAPIVYAMLLEEAERTGSKLDGLQGQVAGAAPPPALMQRANAQGVKLTHVYGLTEVYGPASICEPQDDWPSLSAEMLSKRISRQGVGSVLQGEMEVLNPDDLSPVPWDGVTPGEIMFRGNIVMKGYLDRPDDTSAAFKGGWFHTGDIAVVDHDGYARIMDRSKDIIISGGENISSIELEGVLQEHPSVLATAVVAKSDAKWGEVPFAYIELHPGQSVTADELHQLCRKKLPGFKQPKGIAFMDLPRTSTGKVTKGPLRLLANADSPAEG